MSQNVMSMKEKLKKMVIILQKEYEQYLEEKKLFLNNNKMIEYLFNKPTIKINALSDLIKPYELYDTTDVTVVRLTKNKKRILDLNVISLNKNLDIYTRALDKYEEYIVNEKNIIREVFYYLPALSSLSKKQQCIYEIIYDYEGKYGFLEYTYQWSFEQEGIHLHMKKLPELNYRQNFIYDFYGLSTHKNHLVQFVILYDDNSHFDTSSNNFVKTHTEDIYKQFMLFHMNIHLLRLNRNSNIKTEIFSFLKNIKYTTKYIAVNPIKPINKLFNKDIDDLMPDVKQFQDDYNYNHNKIYIKNYDVSISEYDPEDDKSGSHHLAGCFYFCYPANDPGNDADHRNIYKEEQRSPGQRTLPSISKDIIFKRE